MKNPPLFVLLALIFPVFACVFVLMIVFHFVTICLVVVVDNYFRLLNESYGGTE